MGQRRFFALILLLTISLFSFSAWSQNAVQITAAQGASNFIPGVGTNIPLIYAGVVGPDCNASGILTCSNCGAAAGNAGHACNSQRIGQNSILRLFFTVTAATVAGPGQVGFSFGGGTISPLPGTPIFSQAQYAQGQTGSVDIPWSTLCGLTDGTTAGDATCNAAGGIGYIGANIVLYVGITNVTILTNDGQANLYILGYDGDQTAGGVIDTITPNSAANAFGIGAFHASPGDGKIYVTDITTVAGSFCNPTYVGNVRVFYSPNSLAEASYGGPSVDLPMGVGCAPIGDWIVDGLQNGTSYYFNISIRDLAFNNVFLIDPAFISAQGTCNQPINNPGVDAGCDYIATPGAVTGLLPNAFNCFISTAAYGSGFAPKVDTFRRFRDRFLITNALGRAFTLAYYKYGKIMAEHIAGHPARQFVARIFLTPLWALAWLSIQYGIIGTLLIILATWFLVSTTWRELRRAH